MIKAVLLDWDGTVVDSKKAILASYGDATVEVLGRRFPDNDEDVTLILPMRAQESFGMLSEDPEEVERLIAAYHTAYLRNSAAMAQAFPEARATLEELRRRGLQLGVVTSKGRARVDSDMERHGLTGLFDQLVTGDVSVERKPHPGPVLDALAMFGITAAEALYVGDGPQDVIAGRDAGVRTVAAVYGFHTEKECVDQHPDHVIKSIAELPAVLDGLGVPAQAGTG